MPDSCLSSVHHIYIYIYVCVYIIRQWKGNCEREKKRKENDRWEIRYVSSIVYNNIQHLFCWFFGALFGVLLTFYSYHSIFHFSPSLSLFVSPNSYRILSRLIFDALRPPKGNRSDRNGECESERKSVKHIDEQWTERRRDHSFFVMFCFVWWINDVKFRYVFPLKKNFKEEKKHTHSQLKITEKKINNK